MEDNQVYETRRRRYKKKRLRKGRVVFLSIIIVLISLIAYSVFQYKQGLELAGEIATNEDIEFVADKVDGKNINFLLIGIDSRGEVKSRSDTMMLLSWNKDTNELKLVSFMRDIYADIPGYDKWKLNTAYYLGGVQLLKDTLNHMFDIPIHHYMVIDFQSFESLIDILAPNGIEIEVEKDMSAYIGVSLSKGTQQLNGKELLGYARFRHDAEGDFGRVERQQKVMDALKDELLKPTNIKNLPKLVGAAQGYVHTDLTAAEELKTALSVITGGSPTLEKMTIPVEGAYRFKTYKRAGSVIELDLETNKQKLHEFLNLAD